MNKKVIKYIQDNRVILLIGITIAIGISTVLLINSFIFRNEFASKKKSNQNAQNNIINNEGNNNFSPDGDKDTGVEFSTEDSEKSSIISKFEDNNSIVIDDKNAGVGDEQGIVTKDDADEESGESDFTEKATESGTSDVEHGLLDSVDDYTAVEGKTTNQPIYN